VLQGVWPNVEGDFDGDAKADLLVAGDDVVAVYLATPGMVFAREAAAQVPVKTTPHVIVRDLTDSQRTDIIMWYREPPEWQGLIKVLMNTGQEW